MMIRGARPVDEAAIAAAVAQGAALSRAGGVVAVGDIAGAVGGRPCAFAAEALSRSGLVGISFVEFFGLGGTLARVEPVLRELLGRGPQGAGVRWSLSPHAPYSVSAAGYALAAELAHDMAAGDGAGTRAGAGLVCTHLAESSSERELVTHGRGPLAEMLKGLGVYDEEVAETFGEGESPVERIVPLLGRGSIAVHLNDVSDSDIDLLARRGVCVAYCPRASAYFGAERHFGPHRYRRMLEAGTEESNRYGQ